MLAAMRTSTVAVSRRRLTLATGIQIGARVLGAALGVLVAAALARGLTRAAFGELSLALSILALAASLGDLGIGQIAIREMARAPEDRDRIVGALCAVQLTMGLALWAIGTVVALILMSGTQARVMAALVMATMPLGAVNTLTLAANARLRPELVIVPTLVQNVIWLGIVVALGAAHASLSLYGAGVLASVLAQSGVSLGVASRVTKVTFAGTKKLVFDLLRVAWPLGLAGVFVTAYYRIDAVLLFHYRGAAATAYYSAAYRVLDVLQILPMTVCGVLLPLLASVERESGGEARVQRLFELVIGFLLALAMPIAACGAVLAPEIVTLVYGHPYHPSIALLQVLLPAFIPICMGYVLTSQLILRGVLRPYIIVTFVGAVLNVAANALTIPRYGAAAAAWITLATELIVMACLVAVVAVRLKLRPPMDRALRALAATIVAGVAVWFVRSQPLPVGLVVGAVVYPPCLLASRAISLSELRGLLAVKSAANA